ncbi:MAG: rod shape-determining protein MreC [Acidobacteriota bacterium]|nr:rod shape-determining protein MreC [Acidobacteriota bacterium]
MLDIRRRTGILLFVMMMGHIFLISVQVQSKSGVPMLQAVTFGAFAQVQGGTSSVLHGGRSFWGNYIALRGARAENESLHKQVTELEIRLQEQRALAQRATRLQELLDLKASTPLPTIAADVIAGNPNPGMRTITIGRGTADGVEANMAVIAAAGIIGRVVGTPAAHAARVQLLIDRYAAAGAVVERTRAGGMVAGIEQDPPLTMDLVSNQADVKTGDLVVASGVDGIYPKGFRIGYVESSEKGPQLYRIITVRPAINFSSLDEVLVVLVPARPVTPEAEPEAAGPTK